MGEYVRLTQQAIIEFVEDLVAREKEVPTEYLNFITSIEERLRSGETRKNDR